MRGVQIIDWAYAAGFFDGEGHVRIQRHSKRGSYMLQVSISQATEEPLAWFKEKFGGTIHRRTTKYKGTDKAMWGWQASSGVAEAFLRGVQPFIKTKSDEIALALKFRATFLPQKRAFVGERLDNSVIEKRAAMARRIKEIRAEKRERA